MSISSGKLLTKQCGRDIVHRWEHNPLIGINDLDFNCSDIHNAGVIDFQGEVLLLVRAGRMGVDKGGLAGLQLAVAHDAAGHVLRGHAGYPSM